MWGQRQGVDNGSRADELGTDVSETQEYFLQRLRRLAALRLASRRLPHTDQRLVDHALYSTYWDCVELGLRTEARTVLNLPAEAALAA